MSNERKDVRRSVPLIVNEETGTLFDPETGKTWPIYFKEPKDMAVIEDLVEKLKNECEKRMLPVFARVVRSHSEDGYTAMAICALPGRRTPSKFRRLVNSFQEDSSEGNSLVDILKALSGL